jgi:hypothetical protein
MLKWSRVWFEPVPDNVVVNPESLEAHRRGSGGRS